MSLHTWWLFLMMTFLVSATPGPNMLLVMSSSARFGFQAALATMAGCMVVMVLMMGISAAGLGALLQSFPAVFNTLRWLGAAYLAYLGIKCWREPVAQDVGGSVVKTSAVPDYRSLFRRGVLVAGSNPKAILFAVAFLPQFIDATSPQLPQFTVLLLTFSLVEAGWYMVYAGSGKTLAHFLRRAAVLKMFNRATGGVFVGFAAVMATVRN
jgi:threonine/homoserine/homoserine lactone efflux protein